jgi:lipid II:glycine glycyltransferase (peptidoglycan interpeptide bridge formation enzyme)
MKLMLCTSPAGLCSGLIASTVGDTALYLFGATSAVGMKSRGSYLLQWRFIEKLQAMGIAGYDLNGINPDANPGTYKFKKDLGGENGKDVRFLGQFDCRDSWLSSTLVKAGESARAVRRALGRG